MAFFKSKKNSSGTYKAVFSVSIDTNNEQHNHLVPGGEYWFGKQERRATYDDLKNFASEILIKELRDECEQSLNIPVLDIKVNGIYEGSIELFFTVLFGVISTVAGIKDLYDSINLLRMLAEKILVKRFRERYGDNFRIDVDRQIPRDTHWYDDYNHPRYTIPVYRYDNAEQSKRDGFFYYLLISNIVLLATIIVLVANAVIKVYF